MGDAVMANPVYERTRSALAGLLPRRAATSVLDRALRRHRRSPDEVDGEQMARVLLSGVYRELRGVLPDPGLRRTLRELARETRAAAAPGRGATPSEVRAGPSLAPPAVALAPATPPAAAESGAVPLAAPEPAEGDAAAPTAADDGRSLASLDAVATVLAALDGVHGVGLFDAAGRPLGVRGALHDAAALGRMVAAGAALLETADQLRSVAVDTPRGRLVALPVRPRWLALTGTADLNLGAVYAALATLEEER